MPGRTRGRDAAHGYISTTTARRILTRDQHICHVCGHDGADQVDHITPWAEGGTHHPTNLAPIHGTACPTCDVKCHEDKTKAEAKRGRQRAARRRYRPPEPHPGARAAGHVGGTTG